MPTFIPQHTPTDLDAFTTACLECAEWLARSARTGEFNSEDRERCKDWTKAAIKQAKEDCQVFQTSNADLLILYTQETGRDLSSAGHDFWLTRNRHGAGFWDRGTGQCLKELTDSSHAYGECNAEFYRNRLHLT